MAREDSSRRRADGRGRVVTGPLSNAATGDRSLQRCNPIFDCPCQIEFALVDVAIVTWKYGVLNFTGVNIVSISRRLRSVFEMRRNFFRKRKMMSFTVMILESTSKVNFNSDCHKIKSITFYEAHEVSYTVLSD